MASAQECDIKYVNIVTRPQKIHRKRRRRRRQMAHPFGRRPIIAENVFSNLGDGPSRSNEAGPPKQYIPITAIKPSARTQFLTPGPSRRPPPYGQPENPSTLLLIDAAEVHPNMLLNAERLPKLESETTHASAYHHSIRRSPSSGYYLPSSTSGEDSTGNNEVTSAEYLSISEQADHSHASRAVSPAFDSSGEGPCQVSTDSSHGIMQDNRQRSNSLSPFVSVSTKFNYCDIESKSVRLVLS